MSEIRENVSFSGKSGKNRLWWMERKPSGPDQCLFNKRKSEFEGLKHRNCGCLPHNSGLFDYISLL